MIRITKGAYYKVYTIFLHLLYTIYKDLLLKKTILNLGLIEVVTLDKISNPKFQIFEFQAIETCVYWEYFQLQITFFQSNCTISQLS